MILHLISSPVFLEYVITQFEHVNKGNNQYCYIYTFDKDKNKIADRSEIKAVQRDSDEYFALLDELDKYEALILHSLNPAYYTFVLNAPDSLKIFCIVFGTEIYTVFKKIRNKTYLPKTRILFFFSKEHINEALKPVYRFLVGRKSNTYYTRKSLQRIDYIAMTVSEVHKFLVDSGLTKAQFIEFGYYSIEETIGEELIDKIIDENNIFIGNSSSFSNNHLEVFNVLAREDLGDKEIYVPLSYGNQYLRKVITKVGFRKFGERFRPLLTFLPIQEYNEIILRCGFVIMNHLRPQARGNILTALWLGAKVFFNSDTLYYQELRQKGLLIFSISEISEDPEKAFTRLSTTEIEHNRKILSELYGQNIVLSRTKKLVETALSGNNKETKG